MFQGYRTEDIKSKWRRWQNSWFYAFSSPLAPAWIQTLQATKTRICFSAFWLNCPLTTQITILSLWSPLKACRVFEGVRCDLYFKRGWWQPLHINWDSSVEGRGLESWETIHKLQVSLLYWTIPEVFDENSILADGRDRRRWNSFSC